METKTNIIISAIVAIAIIVSIAVFVYVNLPEETVTPDENPNDTKTVPATLTLIYDDEQLNLSFGEIERLESYTAKGGYKTSIDMIKGTGNYTGVNITTLVNLFDPAPYKYTLQVISTDGDFTYNYSTIQGNITIYNPDNASETLGKGNLTMVLAYQYEGQFLDETSDGKLKIVFLDKQGSITESSLWRKKVESIRIITE
jgi:hypothetical protein